MMTSLTISAVQISHSAAYGPDHAQIRNLPSVRLTLSDGTDFRGDGVCQGADLGSAEHRRPIKESLANLLTGQELGDFFPLCDRIAAATFETEEYRLPDPTQASAAETQKKNRREMLSILGVVEQKVPEPVLTQISHPLPAWAVRATTAALLQACSHAQGQSVGDFVAHLLGMPLKGSDPLRLGLDVGLAEHAPFVRRASAICYTIPAESGAKQIGKNSEKFQKYLRQLNGWINDSWGSEAENRPWLFINLNGVVHRLNEEKTGKTLGSLFGYSTVGDQEKMIFANAVSNSSALTTANDQTQLKSLVNARKLTLKLAAGSWTSTLADVTLWLEKCKPELIALNEQDTPNVGELLQMIGAVSQSAADLILVGGSAGNDQSWGMVHTIAQAARPEIYIPAGGKHGYMRCVNV